MSDFNVITVRQDTDLKSRFVHDKCDKYDYLLSVGCGMVAGLVDVFLVGEPGNSVLGQWTDRRVDDIVKVFAKRSGWTPRDGQENSVKSAIGFLERKFGVNYDQRHSVDVDGVFKMSTKNHHMKSLAHAPDILGLFFSILNQFTSTSTFLSDGKLIVLNTVTHELQGNNFVSKLFCGVANWIGHIMSDVAGSSGATGRGSGVVIPFFELFQLCDFGSFQVGQNRNTLATVATKVFQEGYDARFGLTLAIPVVLCDLSIKFLWAIKRYFYHKRPLKECVPNQGHDNLRMMLIVGGGTLCIMDGADAALRSGGDWVSFFLRLNIVAWYRLTMRVFREVCIRAGISFSLQKQLDSYIQINAALTEYVLQLEKIDRERFKIETEKYNNMIQLFERNDTGETLNKVLYREYRVLGIKRPFDGEFEDFMKDSSAVLKFKL